MVTARERLKWDKVQSFFCSGARLAGYGLNATAPDVSGWGGRGCGEQTLEGRGENGWGGGDKTCPEGIRGGQKNYRDQRDVFQNENA